jgi:hypothetical protein
MFFSALTNDFVCIFCFAERGIIKNDQEPKLLIVGNMLMFDSARWICA